MAQPGIYFDEENRTFRLYCGKSLYAFAIGPDMNLEHLYWGKSLSMGYDLRYLCESVRAEIFAISEIATEFNATVHASNADTMVSSSSVADPDLPPDLGFPLKAKLQRSFSVPVFSTNSKIETNAPSSTSLMSGEPLLAIPFSHKELALFTNEYDTYCGLQRNRLQNLIWRIEYILHQQQGTIKIKQLNTVEEILHGYLTDCGTNQSNKPISYTLQESSKLFTNKRNHIKNILDSHHRYLPGNLLQKLMQNAKNDHILLSEIGKAAYRTYARPSGSNIGKGMLLLEYSDNGTGDFRPPSFQIVCPNGSSITPLKYCSHTISPGKAKMPNYMPSIHCETSECTTLSIVMADQITGVVVELIYNCMHAYDVITRRTVFRNSAHCTTCHPAFRGEHMLEIANSMTLDMESSAAGYYITKLTGSWARERYMEECKVTQGTYVFGSTKGVSSHEHQPFVAITEKPPREHTGEIKGFLLVYSGNFQTQVHVNHMSELRINLGINPTGFQWSLLPGGNPFYTPEAILVRSDEGLSGMSRTLHRLFINNLIPKVPWYEYDLNHNNVPVVLNTWEARYFNIDHNGVVELAKLGASIGVNVLVIDDGWFGERNNTESSIGDWVANPIKFPFGLQGVAKELSNLDLRLGLWIEPEMISIKSNLYHQHPTWLLGVHGRPLTIGRNQYALDLSRSEVREHIIKIVVDLIKSNNIEYIKWDMNRPLTEVFSQYSYLEACDMNPSHNIPSKVIYSPKTFKIHQGETLHRHILGLYEVQARILAAVPNLLIENSASGGGRFDPGMLHFSPQIWCSDNTDSIARMKIQYGTSLLYPARCIGAHITSVPNHITGNTTSTHTRGLLAMCGTFGLEMDLAKSQTDEIFQLKEYIKIFKLFAPIIHRSDLYRLWNPFKSSITASMYVSYDKTRAIVFAFSVNSDHWSIVVPRLKLFGLIPSMEYIVCEPLPNDMTQKQGDVQVLKSDVDLYQLAHPTLVLSGDILMSAGLPLKFFTLDDSICFYIQEKPSTSYPKPDTCNQVSHACCNNSHSSGHDGDNSHINTTHCTGIGNEHCDSEKVKQDMHILNERQPMQTNNLNSTSSEVNNIHMDSTHYPPNNMNSDLLPTCNVAFPRQTQFADIQPAHVKQNQGTHPERYWN